MQNLFQRSGVTDGAGGASQTNVGGGTESAGTGGGDAANQIDEFRAVVDQLRQENPGMTITAIRQMAIKQMTQDRLNWSSANASGLQGGQSSAAHIAHQSSNLGSSYSGHASSSLAAMGDRGGGRRRISERSGSGDEQTQSILDAVRKVGQDAIKTIRQGGALEEEIDDANRVLMRRGSDSYIPNETDSDESDYSDETDSEEEGGHAAESMRSIRSTRSIEAEKRAKKKNRQKKKKSSKPSSVSIKDKSAGGKKKKKTRPDGSESTRSMLSINEKDTTFGSHDASTSVRSRRQRRSSYTGKCAATSMKSISENHADDDADYEYRTRRGSNESGGPMAGDYYPRRSSIENGAVGDVTRSERSLNMTPGEFVCEWKHTRRASTGSSYSGGDSHGSGLSFDDSYGEGSLICGFGTRRGSTGSKSPGLEKEMKGMEISGRKGSAADASSSSRKKGAGKNPYLQF